MNSLSILGDGSVFISKSSLQGNRRFNGQLLTYWSFISCITSHLAGFPAYNSIMGSKLHLQSNYDVSGSARRGSSDGAVFDGRPFEFGAVFHGRSIASSRKARRVAAA